MGPKKGIKETPEFVCINLLEIALYAKDKYNHKENIIKREIKKDPKKRP